MLSNEDALNVGLIHLKKLVHDLDEAMISEREGEPLTEMDFTALHNRAVKFILEGVVTETLMGEATLAIVITNAFDEDDLSDHEEL